MQIMYNKDMKQKSLSMKRITMLATSYLQSLLVSEKDIPKLKKLQPEILAFIKYIWDNKDKEL